MKEKIKKYLPDFIILIGIYMASYNLLRPVTTGGLEGLLRNINTNYHTDGKVLGIMLIAIGIDIAIRRYLRKN